MDHTQIGNLKLKNPYFLAPMHNVNDIAFRILCKKAGAGLVYTELTNPESRAPMNFKDKPAIQLVCNQTRGIKEFIKKNENHTELFDFNLGCPSPHAKQSKIGYFMISQIKTIANILKTIRQNTKKPITLKIRKMSLPTTKSIIKIAEKYCDAIAVHPRTCNQGYSGEPDLAYAKKVKKLTKLPVIYSGNITNKQEADNLLKTFDFVMIGRAAIGNPNIFSELTKTKPKKPITFKDYIALAKKHKIDFHQIKTQAMGFTKSTRGAAKKRNKLVFAKTLREITKIMKA